MRNSIIVLGVSLMFFSFGYFFSSAINGNARSLDNSPVIQQNDVRMVEGMELVFMTEDGKMVFKRTMVPEGTMSVEDFVNYMQKHQRPSTGNVAISK